MVQIFYQNSQHKYVISPYLPCSTHVTANCKVKAVKGFKTNPEDFIPIPLLPLISKIIERIVYNQVDVLLQNNILYKYQSEFRKNYLADFWLSLLNDKILKRFNK